MDKMMVILGWVLGWCYLMICYYSCKDYIKTVKMNASLRSIRIAVGVILLTTVWIFWSTVRLTGLIPRG